MMNAEQVSGLFDYICDFFKFL